VQLRPEECRRKLEDGNARFCAGKGEQPAVSRQRMAAAAADQQPFAAVIACSDSRCPVELVFDQSWGQIFVIRVAGNVCTPEVIGSAEFAAESLKIPLLVVLGHTKCGAVTAAASGHTASTENLRSLLERIQPAVQKIRDQRPGATQEEIAIAAVEANVLQTIGNLLAGSTLLAQFVRDSKCRITGAILDISTGEVSWLGDHPREAELVRA
jgi:carbonic anhydrase